MITTTIAVDGDNASFVLVCNVWSETDYRGRDTVVEVESGTRTDHETGAEREFEDDDLGEAEIQAGYDRACEAAL